MFFLSVSEGYAAAVAAGEARFGTGTLSAGSDMFTRSPREEPTVAFATAKVLIAVTPAPEVATLKNAMTLTEVRLASLETSEILSMIAPSFVLQSTNRVRFALGVLKLVAVVSPADAPSDAKECNGRSTSSGILLELVVANALPQLN